MMKFKSIAVLFLTVILNACSDQGKDSASKTKKCLCDSIGTFYIEGKVETFCYVGKSKLEIASKLDNDTVSITRSYRSKDKWEVQEYLIIANNKIVDPNIAMYCNIVDTADSYKLVYISNEFRFKDQGIITHSILGIDVILNNDTIHTNNIWVLIPKAKFAGIIKIDKKIDATYNNKRQILKGSVFIETETAINYGDLLKQYDVINMYCNKNVVK